MSDARVTVRPEAEADVRAIRAILEAAFPTRLEADLVDQLRADGDVVLSLIAGLEGDVVGYAMFSRMRRPAQTLGLGPVAVCVRHRRKGIAAGLIRAGLRRAGNQGWKGVFVLGDPAYYRRFGFDPDLAAGFTTPYARPYLMALTLGADGLPARTGKLEYAGAFAALE